MTPSDDYRNETWVAVATAPGGDPGRSLQPIHDVLEAAAIPVGFDPYQPGAASSPYPSPQRAFTVVVPVSFRDQALEVLGESGIAVPGVAHAGFAGEENRPLDFSHSDRVLDEDLDVTRGDRTRRFLALGLVIVLIAAVACTLYQTLAQVFDTLPPAVP
jgi:hypothetical protein